MDISKELGLEDLEGEVWKDIEGYKGTHSISNLGRVRTNGYYINSRWALSKGKYIERKIRKLQNNLRGYRMLQLRCHGKSKPIHRIVAHHFIPNPLNLPMVNHLNGDKKDNRAINLEWCTAQRNAQHSVDNGFTKIKKGSELVFSKLTEKDVIEIKIMLKKGIYQKQIGEKFGVNKSTISAICVGRNWSHVIVE